jgi:CubicO group peptidase (beta-lactamase class C family)
MYDSNLNVVKTPLWSKTEALSFLRGISSFLNYFVIIFLIFNINTKATDLAIDIPKAYPSDHGVDERKILDLVAWIETNKQIPIYSLLISRNGNLILELYTSNIERDDSHYLMSVTKSVLSTLIGIAVDQNIISSENAPLNELIPPHLFKRKKYLNNFGDINLKDVMGMAALDLSDPPRDNSPRAIAIQRKYLNSPNRFEFVLESPTQSKNPKTLKYNDQTPTLASGILSYISGKSAFDFAKTHLFDPLGFKNAEWMHQDETGINMGGYGLRLRPIDMQKLGILYLQNGNWNNTQIISKEWVDKTSNPYIGYGSNPVYGYFWWFNDYGSKLKFQEANGWKGQRIAFNRDKGVVITMTACIEKNKEEEVFKKIMNDFVIPALDPVNKSVHIKNYDNTVIKVKNTRSRIDNSVESRMVPSKENKEVPRAFIAK